ncbi:MAG: TerC family protein, partial [Pseudomonadota bacterium]
LSDKLPPHRRSAARRIGLLFALITRILLLSLIFVLAHLSDPLLSVMEHDISIRDIVLIIGGLFLMGKGALEIHHKMEVSETVGHAHVVYAAFAAVIVQIVVMDIVFSFDSVLTAIGVAEHVEIMIAAIIVSVLFMLAAVNFISDFIARHPTLKILALSYMILIGVALIGEGMHQAIPKGYLYFAMAFSFGVEGVNMNIRRKHKAAIERAKHSEEA